MAIIKREGKSGVRYQVRLFVNNPETGKRSQRTFGTFRTVREAQRVEREAITSRDGGTLLTPDKSTIGELLDQWVKVELPKTVRRENRQGYTIVIERYLKPKFGGMQVKALSVEAVETFYADLQEQGKSTSTIRKVHMRLHAALRMAKRHGKVSVVVTEVARPPRVQYGEKGVWTPREVSRFLAAAANDGMGPIWRLAVETGARTSELLGLTWADFDPLKKSIRVGKQVVRLDHGHPIIKTGGKTASALRTIRITDELVGMLSAHRKTQSARRLSAAEWTDHDLIFATRSGKPYNARFLRKAFDGLVEDAGVPNIGPHGIRRTSVTLTIAGGANIKAVAARHGHRDVSTTIGIYQQITGDMDDHLLNIVANFVGAAEPESEATPDTVSSHPARAFVG